MPENKTELEDRNIIRFSNEESNKITRECIETAFLSLLSEKEIDKITISEIVKKAGVSRTGFYRNYKTKEEVVAAFSNELLNELNQFGQQAILKSNPHIIYKNIFSRVKNDSKQFLLLLNAGFLDSSFVDVRSFLSSNYPDCDTQIRYILYGWSGMIRNIVVDWYLGGMKEDIDMMSELCSNLSDGMVRQIAYVDPNFKNNF